MSHHHHHHDEQTEMIDTNNDNSRSIPRRHSHAHLHLKPTLVFDHIKTKVKRKRISSHNIAEVPAFTISRNFNGDIHPKRSNQEQGALGLEKIFVDIRSHPTITSSQLSEQRSDDSHENHSKSLLESSSEKDENPVAVVPEHINEEEETDERIQWRSNSIGSPVDRNTKSKLKTKLSKTPSESDTKTRRPLTRQPVQSLSKCLQIHDEDFNTIFTHIPSDEQLIVAYPCAWRKDIFMHGRIFLSMNYLCFYTCFFKWEESLSIAYKDIISVKRMKSDKILPNAIELRTKNRDQYVFASYIPRERIFIAIYRLWQNALLEKPLDYQQLRTIVYADQVGLDESTGDSEESTIFDEHSLKHTSNRSRKVSKTTLQSDERLNPPAELGSYASSCPCETHLGRTYAERMLTYPIDQLFELTFGDNSFTRAFHDSQKLTDYITGEWRRNAETGKRERQVTYRAVTQSMFGTNTITCTERQILEVEKPHSMYVVNTEVYNEGIKYTDTFFVATRFCMFQRDVKHSFLRITAEIRYVKNVNGIAKSFIEKNCHSNIDDGVNNQIRRLENQQTIVNKHRPSSKKHARKRENDGINSTERSSDATINPVISSSDQTRVRENSTMDKRFFVGIELFIGISLLILHIYLCYKLYTIDRVLHIPSSACISECQEVCFSKKSRH